MTSSSNPVLSKSISLNLTVPNDDIAAQTSRTDSPKASEKIANSHLLKSATPSQSLQGSSVSSTIITQDANDDNIIQPVLPNGFHDPPLSPLRRRRTRGTTISENTEAWDKSYVFSFGMLCCTLYNSYEKY
jgi:hypothetical protein